MTCIRSSSKFIRVSLRYQRQVSLLSRETYLKKTKEFSRQVQAQVSLRSS